MNKLKFPFIAGFSLVELMVVIAIIGILSAIAMPSYKQYIIKAKIASGFSILENMKIKVMDKYMADGVFPDLDFALSGDFNNCHSRVVSGGGYPPVPGPGNYLGRIVVVYNFPLDNSPNPALQMAAHENNGIILWSCFAWAVNGTDTCWGYGIPAKYLPSGCTNTPGCQRSIHLRL